jgi:hypothetical protein
MGDGQSPRCGEQSKAHPQRLPAPIFCLLHRQTLRISYSRHPKSLEFTLTGVAAVSCMRLVRLFFHFFIDGQKSIWR